MPATDEFRSEIYRSLLSLKPNWDSYGAVPIKKAALDHAFRFCDSVKFVHQQVLTGFGQPHVVPCPNGNVQLEWNKNGVEIEIQFDENGNFTGGFDVGGNHARK